jgi:hypothetical protein
VPPPSPPRRRRPGESFGHPQIIAISAGGQEYTRAVGAEPVGFNLIAKRDVESDRSHFLAAINVEHIDGTAIEAQQVQDLPACAELR